MNIGFSLGCLLLALPLCQGALDHHQASHEWLIGWKGESYSPLDTWQQQQQQQPQPLQPVQQQQQYQGTPAGGSTASAAPPAAVTDGARVINLSKQPQRDGQPWIQLLSWQPRLQLHHNLLTAAEAHAMLNLAQGGQQQQHQGGNGDVPEVADELLYRIEQRIANWTNLPPTHIEGWQLHQGASKSERRLHADLLTDRLATEDFQRIRTATVLLFLSDSDAAASSSSSGNNSSGSSSSSSGWSILFPWAHSGNWRGVTGSQGYLQLLQQGQQVQQQLKHAGLAPATPASGHHRQETDTLLLPPISNQPSSSSGSSSGTDICTASSSSSSSSLRLTGFKKGSALLIWNVLTDGQTPDATAAHVICEAPLGTSTTTTTISTTTTTTSSSSSSRSGVGDAGPWIATTWFHNMPAGQDDPLALAATCVDNNPSCGVWASQGFCDDAPGVMLGLRGLCRLSCSDCVICQQSQTPTPASATAAGLQTSGTQSTAGLQNVPPGVVATGSTTEYVECLYHNMHSQRAEWSNQARGAGVRKARNAIRRDMKTQAAAAAGQAEQQLIMSR